jgi:hypothetical protein
MRDDTRPFHRRVREVSQIIELIATEFTETIEMRSNVIQKLRLDVLREQRLQIVIDGKEVASCTVGSQLP